MAGTVRLRELEEEETIRADGLVAVMFDDNRTSAYETEQEWQEGGSDQVNEIRLSNQEPERR